MRDEHRIWHGGNLGEARRLFPDAPPPWIDLSTGINPVPYPLPPIPPAAFERLPSPADLSDLERIAATAYEVDDAAQVVAAPGTQALIEALPRLRPPGRTAVVGPTYAEHGEAWRKAGHAVVDIAALDLPSGTEAVVVTNPNNPDGRRWSRAALRHVAGRLAERGGVLVVDEAFADLEPEDDSLAPNLPENVVVLRSFGKAYGLAGLRLGFAVARPAVADRLRRALGPWAVSGPAIVVGRTALADREWRAGAARARGADAGRLDELLAGIAGRIVGGTCLFRLIEAPDARALFDHLGRAGIWVRRFRDYPSRLRFGLPGASPEWARLAAALRQVRS